MCLFCVCSVVSSRCSLIVSLCLFVWVSVVSLNVSVYFVLPSLLSDASMLFVAAVDNDDDNVNEADRN